MRFHRFGLVAAFGLAFIGTTSHAATWTWSGALGSATWDTDGQWTTPGAPNFVDNAENLDAGDLIFGASAQTTVNMRPDGVGPENLEDKVLSLTFEAGAPAYTFISTGAAHDIDLFGPMTNNSGVVQTFATGIAFDTAACIVNGTTGDIGTNYAFEAGDHLWTGGNPTYNGPFDVHVSGTGLNALQAISITINNAKIVVEGGTTRTGTYLVDGNGSIILNGAWNPSSSATAVTKTGTGTLVLNSESNNTARPFTISNGIVRAGNNLAMGNATRAITMSGGSAGLGTLQLYNNITLQKNITIGARQGDASTV